MAAADLVTLDQAKAWIGAAASGADASSKLAKLVTAVSVAIDRATGCTILPRMVTETRDGSPNGFLLREWPVISVQSVTSGTQALPPFAGSGLGFVIDPSPGDFLASTPSMLTAPYGGLWKGIGNVRIVYKAGFQVSGEGLAIPVGGGPVNAQAPYGDWGSDQGVMDASGSPMTAVSGAPLSGQYKVVAGAYTFSAADAGKIVSISYGYVPADIANACLEWIADRLAYQDRVGYASKSLGGQETVSYRIADTPNFVKAMLAPFMNVVPIA